MCGVAGHIAAVVRDSTSGFGAPGEATRVDAYKAHVKRPIRVHAFGELDNGGRVHCNDDDYMSSPVLCKLKELEMAKYNKNGRIVGDYTCPGSLRGGWLLEKIKCALDAEEFTCCGGGIQFIKSPEPSRLTSAFERLMSSKYFVYFSDDSCMSLPCTDGHLMANLDISSCDSSCGPAVFQQLRYFCPLVYDDIMLTTINQCRRPCQLGQNKKMLFKPVHYFEYSGTVLTTMLNNLANLAIGEQLMSIPLGSVSETRERVQAVLQNCGWVCTVEYADRPEKLQFLKHSPFRTLHGDYCACLNLGVILRTYGQISWDLPGRGNLETRAEAFNKSLVESWVHAGDTAILHALRLRHGVSSAINVSTESLALRYDVTVAQIEELCALITASRVGDVIQCTASCAVLGLDYSLNYE